MYTRDLFALVKVTEESCWTISRVTNCTQCSPQQDGRGVHRVGDETPVIFTTVIASINTAFHNLNGLWQPKATTMNRKTAHHFTGLGLNRVSR